MTTQAQDVPLSHVLVSSPIVDDSCDTGVEGGECFYCTGPETD